MSIAAQHGRVWVGLRPGHGEDALEIVDEDIVTPLRKLGGLTAEHLLPLLDESMPLTAHRDTGTALERQSISILVILLTDGASSLVLVKTYCVCSRVQRRSFLPLDCCCHKTNLSNNDQIGTLCVLDPPSRAAAPAVPAPPMVCSVGGPPPSPMWCGGGGASPPPPWCGNAGEV